jgi:hypothetical protein
MTTQTDAGNMQLITGDGAEQVAFFGCWLDINQTDLRFPRFPLADPGGPNGPFTGAGAGNPLQSIQQLMVGYHECMVAEIFFWPPGTTTDPIPPHATPASSDRLAQRNLSLVESSNPGWPDAHTVQHTFLVKASVGPVGQDSTDLKAAAVVNRRFGPDELIVRWNNVPRNSTATFYFPEVEADEILRLSALRQHPAVLSKLDNHTLGCRLADITFIPLPGGRGNLAGLISLTLPPKVRTGQVYRLSVEQYSGVTQKTLGAFQMTIPVRTDPEILPKEIRKLSVLRYIQQSIPTNNRWSPMFVRYLDEIGRRVKGLGGDPDAVHASPDGSGGLLPLPPVLINPAIRGKKFVTTAGKSNIQPGATLNIGGDIYPLTLTNDGARWMVSKADLSIGGVDKKGLKFKAILKFFSGKDVAVFVTNPNGQVSASQKIPVP